MSEKSILIGDSENFKRVLKSFRNITNYIECIVGDYNGDKSFLGVPVYSSIDEAFDKFGYNYVIAISNDKDYDYQKLYISGSYEIDSNNIIMARTWLLNVLKTKEDVVHIPPSVRVDVCTKCQLNCVECYMRNDNSGDQGSGYMKFEQFKKLVDENDFIKEIEISNSGEVFLNPDLYKILEYAYNKKVKINIFNGANFNTVSEEVIEALVKFGVQKITFSIDGASDDTYPIYRRNGNFTHVINNIKLLNKYKKKYNSKTPKMYWQYVLFNHNECDIEKAIEMSKELGMTMSFTKDWHRNYKPNNPEKIKMLTGLDYSEDDLYSGFCHPCCIQMLIEPQVNWDGRIFGCCVNYKKSWNMNVFEMPFLDCLNSDFYRNAVLRLLGDQEALEDGDPCTECFDYKFIVNNHCYLRL